MASAMRGFDVVVKFLLTKGAKIDQRTHNFDSPLSLAVWKNFTSVAKTLIQAGANVTGIDRFGDSMLHDASKNGNLELVQYFLTKEMDINHQNNEGYAPLHRAAAFKQAAIVKALIEAKADINLVDNKGNTPFMLVPSDDTVSRALLLLAANKCKAESKASETVPTYASSGGGSAVGVHPDLTKALGELIGAIREQTAEIRTLRLAVEHGLKK